MIQVFHRYEVWEDYLHGMWRNVSGDERNAHLLRAIRFTGDAVLYGFFMNEVTREWPTTCEHNLTDIRQNRRAWLGHAATCYAIGCPEDITRQAWGYLNQQQQDDANAQADAAILKWERAYVAN